MSAAGAAVTPALTGGCQCGAVRFRFEGPLGDASICHCRMCQKAMGNFYAPLVSQGDAAFTWTRGEPKWFQSSSHARRGFCGDCGTPLAYDAPDGIAISIGAFDEPWHVRPGIQFGAESRIPYVTELPGLPDRVTMDDLGEAPFLAELKSFQHPDHDTETWPLAPTDNQA